MEARGPTPMVCLKRNHRCCWTSTGCYWEGLKLGSSSSRIRRCVHGCGSSICQLEELGQELRVTPTEGVMKIHGSQRIVVSLTAGGHRGRTYNY